MSQQTDTQSVWREAFRRAMASKPFMVAVALLALTALGMGAATQFLELKFRKVPVELRRRLEEVPRQLGHWQQISEDEPLEADIEQTLGTKKYIFRRYVDTRIVGPTEIEEMMSKPNMERMRMLQQIEGRKPKAVVHLGVTYYTGMVDTVAHVPDRCYIADGYAPTEYEVRTWKVGKSVDAKGKPKDETVDVRLITFEDATGFSSRISKNVAYFFQVNGEMVSSPVVVRYRLQNLFKADVYYAKIELMMQNNRNRPDVEKVMTDFISAALPEIQKSLPGGAESDVKAPGPTTAPAAGA